MTLHHCENLTFRCKYMKKNQIVSSHKTQLMAKHLKIDIQNLKI